MSGRIRGLPISASPLRDPGGRKGREGAGGEEEEEGAACLPPMRRGGAGAKTRQLSPQPRPLGGAPRAAGGCAAGPPLPGLAPSLGSLGPAASASDLPSAGPPGPPGRTDTAERALLPADAEGTMPGLLLGDEAPNFQADTTHGPIRFHGRLMRHPLLSSEGFSLSNFHRARMLLSLGLCRTGCFKCVKMYLRRLLQKGSKVPIHFF